MDRAYIETTIFNRFFDEKRGYLVETRQFFDCIRNGSIDAYTSAYVVDGLYCEFKFQTHQQGKNKIVYRNYSQ